MATLETSTGSRPAKDILDWARAFTDPHVRASVDELDEPMRRIARYHFGWCDEQGQPAAGDGGKAIRSALVLLCARAVGGDPGSAVRPAAAVELVHNFSLIHDDVMDGDLTRRHRPTVWSVFGVDSAVLAGDALVTLAWHVLADGGDAAMQEGARLLSASLLELVRGQAWDMAFQSRDDVDVGECLAMIEGKTAALISGACAMGAVFGGAGPSRARCLRDFGRLTGMAFQVVDDLLGIWGDPEVLGKPIHADLRVRKKSLPVVAALTSGTSAGRRLAALYDRAAPLSEAEIVEAAELVEMAGGRQWCQEQSDAYLARALGRLDSAAVEPAAGSDLATLATLIVQRDR